MLTHPHFDKVVIPPPMVNFILILNIRHMQALLNKCNQAFKAHPIGVLTMVCEAINLVKHKIGGSPARALLVMLFKHRVAEVDIFKTYNGLQMVVRVGEGRPIKATARHINKPDIHKVLQWHNHNLLRRSLSH